jgi:MFS family permease
MTSRRDTAVVALACTAQFVDVVGVTLLIVALPVVQDDLRLSGPVLSWTAGVYALAFGGALVPGGWVADLVGRRTAFAAGSAGVAAGSAVCAVAGSGGVLVAGRAVQGLGAAVAVPAALALVLAVTPPGPRRGRAWGVWTVAGAAGGACGFVLGGVVTQLAGWRWLFAAIGLIELLAACVVPFLVSRSARGGPGRLDVAGAVLATAAVVALIGALNQGLGSPAGWLTLLAAACAAGGFVLVERRAAAPMVPPWVWRLGSFQLGGGVAAVLTATTSGANVIGTLFAQHVLHLSSAVSGACFLLFSGGVVVASTAAPAALRRLGARRAMAAGLIVIAVAMAVQAAGVTWTRLAVFLIGLTLSGIGLGLASVASTAHGTRDATDTASGRIGGLLNAAAQTGTAIGIALLLAIATGYRQPTAYVAAGAVAVAAAVVCLARRPADPADEADP